MQVSLGFLNCPVGNKTPRPTTDMIAASRSLKGDSSRLPINSPAICAVNLPDLELAVEPHLLSGHLLAALPASLLSMRQGLWRLST